MFKKTESRTGQNRTEKYVGGLDDTLELDLQSQVQALDWSSIVKKSIVKKEDGCQVFRVVIKDTQCCWDSGSSPHTGSVVAFLMVLYWVLFCFPPGQITGHF